MIKNYITIALIVLTGIFINGCLPNGAGLEWGHVPSGTFAPPEYMPAFGSQYTDGWGILYTLKAGSFDPDHRSGTARRTYNNYKMFTEIFDKKLEKHSCTPETGTTEHYEFTYPANWDKVTPEQRQEMALQMAEYTAFNSMIWHEMLTWYHARLFLGLDDFESAFSWEDVFCDLYGAKVAVQALKMEGDFYQNVTDLTKQQLDEWQVVPMEEAWKISRTVKGTWWDRVMPSLHSNIYMRGMDIGCSGTITAVLIPGFYDGEPATLEAPKLDSLDKYGLQMRYTLTSSYSQGKTIADLVGVDVVEPRRDFCNIMEKIKEDCASRPRFLVANSGSYDISNNSK